MKRRNTIQLICLFFVVLISACKKDDNEAMPLSTVSRLYVSNADTDASVVNTMIFDPADQATFAAPYPYDSKLPDGNGIFFNAYSGTVFQVSRRNKTIKKLTVNTDGTLKEGTTILDESLPSAREIAYDKDNKTLYVASNIDSAIYVYSNADTLSGNVIANKKLKLNGQPWGIHLDNNRLFVVIDQLGRAEVQLFESASSLVVGTITPSRKMTIAGAQRLHGITYSASRDILILTDIAEATAGNFNTDGSIIIIEAADTKLVKDGAQVTPTRVISGAATGLGNPVDVAFDARTDKDLIYIAEKANKKILVFKYAGSGNVAPYASSALTSSPEAIYLDAR